MPTPIMELSPSPASPAALNVPRAGVERPTVVCCVEAGALETTSLLMLESLRRWGGALATAPAIAVTPRFGPPLRSSTLKRFDELGVRYVRKNLGYSSVRPYRWYGFLNKPQALILANEVAKTDAMLFIDSDVIVAGDLAELELEDGIGFSACASDCNVGSTGQGDRNEPYWEGLCKTLGLSVEQLPFVQTCRDNKRIHYYINTGVFGYRRSEGFAAGYLENIVKLLDARVASRDGGLFFAEQATAGLVAIKLGLNRKALPEKYNYAIGSKAMAGFDAHAFSKAAIIHYHDGLWDHFFPKLLELCKPGHPEVFEWLERIGPLKNDTPLPWRILSKVLKSRRLKRHRAFEAICTKY